MKPLNPGHYYHFGLENAVHNLLNKFASSPSLNKVQIFVNIDGLPLSKTSSSQVYPTVCNLVQNKNTVEMVGIYHGFEKPESSSCFMEEFVTEAKHLIQSGVQIKDCTYQFDIKGFICDVPARSFILCTKGHSGYYSCFKCNIEGSYLNGRVCFPSLNYTLRTDSDFKTKIQEEHHVGNSILVELPNLNMINSFPADPMHLLYLGVTKKIITLWCSGNPTYRLSINQIEKIASFLISIKHDIPREFIRKPRSLNEFRRWKATEYRTFILYTGIIALRKILNKEMYLNFVTLHVALFILSNQKLQIHYDYADSLLNYFVETFGVLYGKEHISHNIHTLLHLCSDAKYFGSLEEFSAFPFENYMQSILKLIRKSEKPLEQIVFRIIESSKAANLSCREKNTFPKFHKEHFSDSASTNSRQYKVVEFVNFTLKAVDGSDNCCQLKDGSIIIVENFIHDGNVYVIGKKYSKKKIFMQFHVSHLFWVFL